jgi:hypothetical protein
VRHRLKEYVVGKDYTNTIEGYFGLFKRGMRAFISAAQRNTCTAILRNSISPTMRERRLG